MIKQIYIIYLTNSLTCAVAGFFCNKHPSFLTQLGLFLFRYATTYLYEVLSVRPSVRPSVGAIDDYGRFLRVKSH